MYLHQHLFSKIHLSVAFRSNLNDFFCLDFAPLSAFGYMLDILFLLLSPDLALEGTVQLPKCRHPAPSRRSLVRQDVHTALAGTSPHLPDVPGKYPFVVDYFISLEVHSI